MNRIPASDAAAPADLSSSPDSATAGAPTGAPSSTPNGAPAAALSGTSSSSPDTFADRPGDTFVQSFARGLSVIRSFDANRPAQTLSDVATATGLTRAGARRILLTLHTLGYVEADGRLFRLTPKILELGFTYLTSLPFWNLAAPVLEDLSAAVHESASAAVLDGTDIVYVLRVPMQKIMTINLSIGSRLPAYCSSMGRMLLSALDDAELDARLTASPLQRRTPQTRVDIGELKAELARIRQQGWAIVDQELEVGLISLSAPIRNRQRRVIAAMNISGNAQRKNPAQMIDEFLAPLLKAADQVSALVAQRG